MKLSTKSRYGARAIIEIARGNSENPVKRKTIVNNQRIPDSYLKNILISLKEAGLIKAIRGAGGGYILSRPSSEITFYDIIKSLEGSFIAVECIDNPETCEMSGRCSTRDVWKKMAEAEKDVLSNFTIEKLLGEEGEKDILNYCI